MEVVKIFLIVSVVALLLFFIIQVVGHFKGCKTLKDNFSRCNVIVSGKKGTGKDLLFQKVINLRKKPYLSNISYGGDYKECCANDLELANNDYMSFIKNDINIIDKSSLPYEGRDFYFSDCGIILPSQYDSTLHKLFKSFPISYALSRHLWANNIHCNTQDLGRIWKALREQADFYIIAKGVKKLPFGLLRVDFNVYDKYESAKSCLSPLSSRLWNKYSKAERDLYIATNGLVESHFVYMRSRSIKYDTRAYHEKIFGVKYVAPSKRAKKSA
ncbi:MAG: hypothetical protein J1F31_02230 [Erysipelotrichales bacterium]|nr:hypothetical protein [Erysipelotrichales bacterium]